MPGTWNDLIDEAFVDLVVIQPGMSVSGTVQQTDGQKRLNDLIGSLNTEGATVFQQVMQAFALVAGTRNYTLGAGGSFPTTGALRAQRVTSWRAYSGDMDRGGPALSMEAFAASIEAKQKELLSLNTAAVAEGVTSGFPASITAPIPFLLGADTSFPLINIRVYPTPSAITVGTLELAYWTPLAQITDFTATPTLPDGWFNMLHFNLALMMYPLYARAGGIPPELAANASNTKAALVQQNTMPGLNPPAAAAQQQ